MTTTTTAATQTLTGWGGDLRSPFPSLLEMGKFWVRTLSLCETQRCWICVLIVGDSLKGSFLGLVVGKDKKMVLNTVLIALPKREMSLVFWVIVVGDSLKENQT
jgi:hypothetical protein